MKHFKFFASSLCASVMVLTAVLWPHSAGAVNGSNLLQNGDFEHGTLGIDSLWHVGNWGTNTYIKGLIDTDSHTGSRCARFEYTSYQSGDAKWIYDYFVPVSVGSTYHYEQWFRTNLPSKVQVEFQLSGGGLKYVYIGALPVSTSWQKMSLDIVAPAGAVSMRAYQSIAGLGWVEIDDAQLYQTDGVTVPPPPAPSPSPNPSPSGANLIANPSAEILSSVTGLPASWQTSKWGTNNAVFSAGGDAHTGLTSLRTDISNYTGGDAKWMFTPVPITAGKAYALSFWYKLNGSSYITADITTGSTKVYLGLGALQSSATWQQATYIFVAPASATAASVQLPLKSAGFLQIDDVSLSAQ